MHRLKMFGIAALAVFAVGVVTASSASALLPTVLFLSSPFVILLVGSKSGAGVAVFHTKTLVIEAGKITTELTALGNDTKLGSVLLLFFESKDVGTKNACTTAGLVAGEVHISGEWHLVYVGLGASLAVALLVLVPAASKQSFKCGATTVSIEGSALTKITKLPSGEADFEEIGTIAKCEGTESLTPELTKYETESGGEATALLLGVIAGVKEKACEQVTGELILKSSEKGQMIKIDL